MKKIMAFVRPFLRGTGQVMFMGNALTGALFLAGVIVGSLLGGTAVVAIGSVVGLVASTLSACLLRLEKEDGEQGLWGFNGILIGCALPTFFAGSLPMWIALIALSALSPWLRTAMNKPLKSLGINSLTFPFIVLTWLSFCFGFSQAAASVSCFSSVFEAWLNGISQVFLVCSPVCGALFLAGFLVADRAAAAWCAIGSAIGLALAFLLGQDQTAILNGLYGFNPALTAIALGTVFRKSMVITLLGILATFFIQLAVSWLLAPIGIPGLTAPFCIATWLFILITKNKR